MGEGSKRPRSNGVVCRKEIEVKGGLVVDARTSEQRQKDLGEKAGRKLEVDHVSPSAPAAQMCRKACTARSAHGRQGAPSQEQRRHWHRGDQEGPPQHERDGPGGL